MIKNKKAISPTISWILLIGLAVTLAGIVTIWVRETASDTTERVTSNVEADIRCRDTGISAFEEESSLGDCETIILQNRGYFSITKINVRSRDGITSVSVVPPLKPDKETTIDLNINPLSDNTIGLIPFIETNDELIACMQKEINIKCS